MSKKVAIIDYGMGNLMSVFRAWQAAGADAKVVSSPSEISDARILVFPGQGAISDAMKLLDSTGFSDSIREWISSDKPFFGICLGLQALFKKSEEAPVPCLGVFEGKVKKMRPQKGFKIPHMGWNNVDFKREKGERFLSGIDSPKDQFYFVHSFCVSTPDESIVFGTTEYGGINFASAVAKGNLLATQFHPEKSQAKGIALYKNFLSAV